MEKFTVVTEDKVEGKDKVEKEDKTEGKDKAEKEDKTVTEGAEDKQKIEDLVKTEYEAETKEAASHEVSELQEVVQDSSKVFGEEQELDGQTIEKACGEKDSNRSASEVAGDKNKSIVSKLYVHSQWLAVQSPYFKALFYSGMKESNSKEVVMKIYEHELEAHQTLVEAMYKLDVLKDKEYRLVVQVFVLAHKYDARHIFKKCKYVLLSTTPSLEMCKYILAEIKHLSDTADIHEMLEKFLVKEFSPLDETWNLDEFFELSEAALKLLLRSDNLATISEDTIFLALMKWVQLNIPGEDREKCDLLDLVRFEFLSVDFLYDKVQDHYVASQMPGLSKYVVKGLAYRAFSETRREQLEPKPKRRPVEIGPPTFSWVIDEELKRRLTRPPGTMVYSDNFLYRGYSMQLRLGFAKDLNTCSFYFAVCDLQYGVSLLITYKVQSDLFAGKKIKSTKRLYTNKTSNWGYKSLDRNKSLTEKCFTIDVWVKIHE